MNREEISTILCEELNNLAPEVDLATIDRGADMREELEIDSMDFLRLTIALGKRLGIIIADADHARLVTFNAMLDYLTDHQPTV